VAPHSGALNAPLPYPTGPDHAHVKDRDRNLVHQRQTSDIEANAKKIAGVERRHGAGSPVMLKGVPTEEE